MELFDKLGDTIVSVSKDATQKAKDISDRARIRMEIRSKQDYLNKLYLEIGKIYYDAHKDDEEKEFKEQMLLAKDALEVIEELNQQLGQIKGMVRCAVCGQDMSMEADYCSKCGSKLVKPEKETVDESFDTDESSAEEGTDVQNKDDVQDETVGAADEIVSETPDSEADSLSGEETTADTEAVVLNKEQSSDLF